MQRLQYELEVAPSQSIAVLGARHVDDRQHLKQKYDVGGRHVGPQRPSALGALVELGIPIPSGCRERYRNASEVLREGLRLVEREQGEEAAKVAILRQAAEQGWSDLVSGRYDDVNDDSLKDFIGQLGVRATKPQETG